jgi:Uma2 family endonuclease
MFIGDTTTAVSPSNWIKRHKFTVDEYYRMGEIGLIGPEEHVELIEGEIFEKTPICSYHASIVNHLSSLLITVVKDEGIVSVQNPVRLSDRTEPEPDLAILKPRDDFYRKQHPTANDTLLVVEVSNASERFDREIKLLLYANHGIPEIWIISIEQKTLSIYRSPNGDRYEHEQATDTPRSVTLSALPEVSVDLSTLF